MDWIKEHRNGYVTEISDFPKLQYQTVIERRRGTIRNVRMRQESDAPRHTTLGLSILLP